MKNSVLQRKQKNHQGGGLLIEALIAVLIFSIGILALIGLQGVMLKNTMTNEFRAEAAYIAERHIGEMWANPANAINFVDTAAVAVDQLPNGLRQVTAVAGAANTFKVTIGWTAPGEVQEATTTATCALKDNSNNDVSVAHCYSTVATIAGG